MGKSTPSLWRLFSHAYSEFLGSADFALARYRVTAILKNYLLASRCDCPVSTLQAIDLVTGCSCHYSIPPHQSIRLFDGPRKANQESRWVPPLITVPDAAAGLMHRGAGRNGFNTRGAEPSISFARRQPNCPILLRSCYLESASGLPPLHAARYAFAMSKGSLATVVPCHGAPSRGFRPRVTGRHGG